MVALRALPGIGDYTAAALAAIAFDAPAVPVDGNVERVVSRLFALERETSRGQGNHQATRDIVAAVTPERRFRTGADGSRRHHLLAERTRLARYAHGAAFAWRARSAARRNSRARRPSAKANCAGRCLRALRADGRVLLRQRPEKGLLGAMTEVPGSDWAHDFDIKRSLDSAPRFKSKPKWRRLPGVVTHVFTHFPLELTVFTAQIPAATPRLKARAGLRLPILPASLAERDAQGAGTCAQN